MTSLLLPRPLLEPSAWPAGTLFGLDSLKWGGAFAAARRKASPVSFATPPDFWSRVIDVEPSLIPVIETQFSVLGDVTLVSRAGLSHSEIHEWKMLAERAGVSLSFVVQHDLRFPTLSEWSRDVFPETFVLAGEVHWERLLRDYQAQLGGGVSSGAFVVGLDQLRFWPPFLRSQKLAFADTAAVEWANVEALFSPQDDSRGDGSSVLVNPTLQVVTGSAAMSGIWRVDGALNRRALAWEEAAVIDEMRETPRLALSSLRSEMLAKRFPLRTSSPFNAVIDAMISEGLLLLRS